MLDWTVCFKIIAAATYLYYDGKKLLVELVLGVFWTLLCIYMVSIVTLGLFPAVIIAIIIGPIARLCFGADTIQWPGKICGWIAKHGFAWVDKISSLQDKKIAELEAQRAELLGEENRTYPDGFYKLEFKDGQPLCPDCQGRLLAGPEAGCQMMTKCSLCHAEFMYTSFNGMLERINHDG